MSTTGYFKPEEPNWKNCSCDPEGTLCKVGDKGSLDAKEINAIRMKLSTSHRDQKEDRLKASQKSTGPHLLHA